MAAPICGRGRDPLPPAQRPVSVHRDVEPRARGSRPRWRGAASARAATPPTSGATSPSSCAACCRVDQGCPSGERRARCLDDGASLSVNTVSSIAHDIHVHRAPAHREGFWADDDGDWLTHNAGTLRDLRSWPKMLLVLVGDDSNARARARNPRSGGRRHRRARLRGTDTRRAARSPRAAPPAPRHVPDARRGHADGDRLLLEEATAVRAAAPRARIRARCSTAPAPSRRSCPARARCRGRFARREDSSPSPACSPKSRALDAAQLPVPTDRPARRRPPRRSERGEDRGAARQPYCPSHALVLARETIASASSSTVRQRSCR